MATPMSDDERRAFLSSGTRTGILSTVRKDGRPHAAPVWFVLDGDDVVFTTGESSVKGRTLRRTGQAALTVDEAIAPYSFVTISGHVEISEDLGDMLTWATKIGARYMGAEQGEAFGKRNAVAGELLVRLVPDHVVAIRAVAD
jgi:PPOX class probable F420-dependent enzyme